MTSWRDELVDWVCISSNEGTAPVHCDEEGAELEEEAFNLLAHLCSNPQLWSRDLGSDSKNEVTDTRS